MSGIAPVDRLWGLLGEDRLAELRRVPAGAGIAAGAVAWLVGYALMAGLFYLGPPSLGVTSIGERLRGIGLIFYNAQFVDGIETLAAEGVEETVRFNVILEQTSTTVPAPVYFAIPVVALLVLGAVVGYIVLDDGVPPVTIPLLGVMMAIGYLPLAVAGTVPSELAVGWSLGTLVLEPDLVKAAAFGFAYPFVLGTVGAALGHALRSLTSSPR